jgi:hypothetical protein
MPAVTRTTMTLEWLAPNITGGCPVLSYSIFVQDPDNLAFAEVDPENVNNLIELRSYTITFDAAVTGTELTFYMTASNTIGAV